MGDVYLMDGYVGFAVQQNNILFCGSVMDVNHSLDFSGFSEEDCRQDFKKVVRDFILDHR